MKKENNKLVLTHDDYQLMIAYLRQGYGRTVSDRLNAEKLELELRKARLVSKEDFPADIVRLNSRVKVKDDKNDSVMELIVVAPEKADIKERKISVLAPVGTALIGFRQGQKVQWQVPAGKRTFTIVEVANG
jgi:regulator of nucleoside diphosphate kinase